MNKRIRKKQAKRRFLRFLAGGGFYGMHQRMHARYVAHLEDCFHRAFGMPPELLSERRPSGNFTIRQ